MPTEGAAQQHRTSTMFTGEMKAFYDANGYLVVNDVFDADELSQIRDQIDALLANPENPPEGVTIGREGKQRRIGNGSKRAMTRFAARRFSCALCRSFKR